MECVCRDLTHLWTTEQRNAILKLSRLFRTIDSLHKKLSREEFEVEINQMGFILHLRDMLGMFYVKPVKKIVGMIVIQKRAKLSGEPT
jgi:hypothetical protein